MDDWSKFIAHCLDTRLEGPKFETYVRALSNKYPLPPQLVADIFLRPRERRIDCLDPLIPQYVHILLRLDLIDVPAVLAALLRYSTIRPVDDANQKDGGHKEEMRWGKSYAQEEGLIYGLSKIVSAGARPKSGQEVVGTIRAITEWIRVLTLTGAADDMMHELGANSGIQNQEAMAVRIVVGALLVAVTENVKVIATLGKLCPKGSYEINSPTTGPPL